MNEVLYLIFGAILLLLVMYDFFFTTLSASGTGFITKAVSSFSHVLIQFIVKFSGRGIYILSGMIVNLTVLAIWLLIVWLGLFLIFSFEPEAIINSDGRMASSIERLYFTGYTLSTLGLGNFKPVTPFYEVLTSIFSFFGFIFFTSSMTYLISVSSAVINKRSLARSIQNLGKSPQKIAENLLESDASYSYQQIVSLQEIIDRHYVNHQAYPVVHFYNHPKASVSSSINMARLDEAVSILLYSEKGEKLKRELQSLRSSLTNFLDHIHENYSYTLPGVKEPPDALPLPYEIRGADENELEHRRKILGGFLRSESFDWRDVSPGN